MTRIESLVQTLTQCAKHCDDCTAACLGEKHLDMLRNCIRRNIECATFCRATALMVQHDSLHLLSVIQLCASVCSGCREECEKHDHVHCKTCAIVCLECEKLCNEWLAEEAATA